MSQPISLNPGLIPEAFYRLTESGHFTRHPANPVLRPEPTSAWEALNTFNPSVIRHNGLFHMHYRAQGLDYVSHIGYAVSADGVSWNRLRQPVLSPSSKLDARGVEDPRVTELDGRFYMAYTAYSRKGLHAPVGVPPLRDYAHVRGERQPHSPGKRWGLWLRMKTTKTTRSSPPKSAASL